jgi:hypothetical protein
MLLGRDVFEQMGEHRVRLCFGLVASTMIGHNAPGGADEKLPGEHFCWATVTMITVLGMDPRRPLPGRSLRGVVADLDVGLVRQHGWVNVLRCGRRPVPVRRGAKHTGAAQHC